MNLEAVLVIQLRRQAETSQTFSLPVVESLNPAERVREVIAGVPHLSIESRTVQRPRESRAECSKVERRRLVLAQPDQRCIDVPRELWTRALDGCARADDTAGPVFEWSKMILNLSYLAVIP